jgi:hypothetical protein
MARQDWLNPECQAVQPVRQQARLTAPISLLLMAAYVLGTDLNCSEFEVAPAAQKRRVLQQSRWRDTNGSACVASA